MCLINEMYLCQLRVRDMDTIAIHTNENSCTVNEAMNILFSKLDEAIEDVEEGRVQTIDEAWKEIDII